MPRAGQAVPNGIRKEALAINLWDITELPEAVRDAFLLGKVDSRRDAAVLVDEERLDETAVVFTCSLIEACCICDVMRARHTSLRVYIKRVDKWTRLSSAVKLTQISASGKVVLNEEVFPNERKPVPYDPPTFRRVTF